jgi:hypothetical protein
MPLNYHGGLDVSVTAISHDGTSTTESAPMIRHIDVASVTDQASLTTGDLTVDEHQTTWQDLPVNALEGDSQDPISAVTISNLSPLFELRLAPGTSGNSPVHNADGTWSIDPQTVSHIQVHTDDHDGAQSVYQVSVTTTGPDGVTAEIIHSGHVTYNAVIDSSVTLESGLSGTQSSDVFGQVTTVDISASGTLQHIGELLNFTQSDNDESTMLQIRVADGVNIYRPNGLSTYTVSNDIYTDANGINTDRDPGYQTFQVPASALEQAIIMSSSGALTSTDIRIRVEIHEGTGGTGANVSETFHFTGASLAEHNFIPTASATISAQEDTIHHFTANDFGFVDGDAGDVLDHITITTLPDTAEGQLLFNGIAVTANQAIDNADIDKLTFTPASDVVGDVHFGYTVSDGKNDSTPSIATVTLTNVNDAPIITGSVTADVNENTSITITQADLLANATDIDGDTLSATNLQLNDPNASMTDNHDGSWTITPSANFVGDVALNFDISDGSSTVATQLALSINPVTSADTPDGVDSFTVDVIEEPVVDVQLDFTTLQSDVPQNNVDKEGTFTPVDHYLAMLGLSRDEVGTQDISHLSSAQPTSFVGGDNSEGADPLVDHMTPDAFENPLDDEHKSHDIPHENILQDSDLDTSSTENLGQDDDSLHQALNDMHNQF